jgi:hypothetical protein
MTVLALSWLEDQSPRDLVRWAAAAAIVLGIHGGAVALFSVLASIPQAIGDDIRCHNRRACADRLDSRRRRARCRAGTRDHDRIEAGRRSRKSRRKLREEMKVEQPPDRGPGARAAARRPSHGRRLKIRRPPAPHYGAANERRCDAHRSVLADKPGAANSALQALSARGPGARRTGRGAAKLQP